MTEHGFPPAFEHLRELAVHAADRAWTALGHFFVAQSVLLLAWATIATIKTDDLPWKPWPLMALSVVGIVTGVQWSMLTTRMWHYHLAYLEQLKKIWADIEKNIVGGSAWRAVGDDIDKYWKTGRGDWSLKRLSSNQMVLVTAPLLLAVVHVALLLFVAWHINAKYAVVLFAVLAVTFRVGYLSSVDKLLLVPTQPPVRHLGWTMHIYKLTPRPDGLTRPEWKLSSQHNPVQIEATSEQDARVRAAMRFGPGHRVEGTETLLQPWSMPELVSAKLLKKPDPRLPLIKINET